jgi:hypothetical protein
MFVLVEEDFAANEVWKENEERLTDGFYFL